MAFKLINIYDIGTVIPLKYRINSLDEKLEFTFFPYNAMDIILTTGVVLAFFLITGTFLSAISSFLFSTMAFFGLISAVILLIYPFNIRYTASIMEYSEEMLRAILHISTYVQLGVSMESAFLQTEKNVSGILRKQFEDINNGLQRKSYTDLGQAISKYVEVWNKTNHYFVKSIRLLQIAAFSSEEERERLIKETIETLMVNYTTLGKRATEELSKKTNMLIAGGILLPILSLLGLPILSVFMPQMVTPEGIAFVYIILFPTIVLVAALSFSSKRVQIDTIRIKDSMDYKPMGKAPLIIALAIIILCAVPTIISLTTVLSAAGRDNDSLKFFIFAWTAGAGVALGVYIYANSYVKRYKTLWEKIRDIETDLPFILQSFSTYFTLNTPFEKVIEGVVDDYENLGFKDHPAVKGFKGIRHMLLTSKMTIGEIIRNHVSKLIPSSKVCTVIKQIVTFEEVSQRSAAKASSLIRRQVIDTYKLDDYIKTLLSDTVGLINISITFLAPMLCAAAVVMTFAILKSIVFITDQLAMISTIFGGQEIKLTLIDVTQVVPPIFISAIVGIYLLEMIIVLSIFQTQISIGSDFFQTMKTMASNMIGYAIYTVLLFGGYFFVNIVLFKGVLGAG